MPSPGQFTVTVNGTVVDLAAVGAVAVSGNDVILTLAAAVEHGDVVTVSYAVPTRPSDKPIQDAAGNDAEAFTLEATNATPEPRIVGPDPPVGTPRPLRLTITLDLPRSTGTDDEPIDSATLKVYRVTGHEAISQPFRYAIDLLRVDADNNPLALTSGDVLDKTATLTIAVDDGDGDSRMVRNVHGVIEEFIADQYLPSSDADTESRYHLVLVPRLALLARNRQNRIHATAASQTLEELIANKLLSRGADYSTTESANRIVLAEDDFRIDIDNDELPRGALSHVAQYNETDLDFVRRVCEHHGVYFFFASNSDDSDAMVVFGNTNSPFGVVRFHPDPDHTTPASTEDETEDTSEDTDDDERPATMYAEQDKLEIELTLTGATGLVDGSQYSESTVDQPAKLEGVMFSFKSVRRPVPGSVRVIDDNGSGRGVDLRETVTLDADSHGIYTDYDTRFSSETEGMTFATIRSQELKAAGNYYLGLTNSPCVAPGRTFKKALDADTYTYFLVTEVDIDIRQAHPGVIAEIDKDPITTGFTNRFRCIDFDATAAFVFRPPRVTPLPRLHGVHTAYIATGEEDRPKPDAQGAYRVYHKHAEERTDLAIDTRSMPVRKAEPYAGDGVGMHFPLKEDTEVLLAYRNGDPDRPVIAAAMPSPGDHASPVTDANPTSHVVETSSGARFEIHDGYDHDSARVALRSREDAELASYFRLGSAHVTDPESTAGTSTLEDHYVDTVFSAEKDEQGGIALLSADHIREAAKKHKITEVQKSVHVRAGEDIHARSVQKHLLSGRRMVIHSGPEDEEPTADTNAATEGSPYTIDDDDTLVHASGGIYLKAQNDIRFTAKGESIIETGDTARQVFHSDLHTHVFANDHKLVAGSSNLLVLGAGTSLVLGTKTHASLGSDITLLGPLVGYFGFGAGVYVWPQLCAFHGVITNNVIEKVRITHCPIEKKSSALSIKHQALRLYQSQIEARIDNLCMRIVGMYTML